MVKAREGETNEIVSRDEQFMARALELARMGLGRTSPNPMVGCVIVREGRIVGEGFHEAAGEPHAEVVALKQAGPRATRASVYVTLEPCCFRGRTPPCTDALIEAGVARVVAGVMDPNRRVAGKGFARLREAGIDVVSGVLESQAARLNEAYAKWISRGLPFVTAKWAMSLDGKTSVARGIRTRLTGDEADKRVHELRAASDAIVVGIGTVLADDPQLTVRHGAADRPVKPALRVVVDSAGRMPPESVLARTARETPTLLAATASANEQSLANLRAAGVDVVQLPSEDGRVSIAALLQELGRRDVCGVLLEGGPALAGSFAAAGAIDKVVAFVAPRLLLAADAPPAMDSPPSVAGLGSMTLRDVAIEQVGSDVMITGYPAPEESEQQCLPV